jgi:hypothetical protein
MVDLIIEFLKVGEMGENSQIVPTYDAWVDKAARYGEKGKVKMLANPGAGTSQLSEEIHSAFGHIFGKNTDSTLEGWQQFVIHAKDERGDGVSDYLLEVLREVDGSLVPFEEMYADVHAYRTDPSYRCFHIRLPHGISSQNANLKIRVHASSGTALIGYQGYKDLRPDEKPTGSAAGQGQAMTAEAAPVILDVADLGDGSASLFHPFTTTLIELLLSREPTPLLNVSDVFTFIWENEGDADDSGTPADAGTGG